MAFGRLGQALFFGLPGNPVAVMVSFIQLVRPALLRLAGRSGPPGPPMLEVPCATAIRKKPGRTEYLRGHLAADPDGQTRVRPTPDQGSGVLRSMSEANCLIVLEAAQADLPAGARVCVQPFEGLL
jgi:molybdopterin molybdotransferase